MALDEQSHTPSHHALYAADAAAASRSAASDGIDIATSSGTRSFALRLGLFLSLALFLAGLTDGSTSVVYLDSFAADYCVGWDGLKPFTRSTASAPNCGRFADAAPWSSYVHWYKRVYLLGAIGGALLGGAVVADWFGRQTAIISGALVFASGAFWALVNPARARSALLGARMVQGLGTGMVVLSVLLYWVETAPKELRGAYGAVLHVTLSLGTLVGALLTVSNTARGSVDDASTQPSWHNAFALALGVALVLAGGTRWLVPLSPRWVAKTRGSTDANAALQHLRRTANVREELHAIDREFDQWHEAWWVSLQRVAIASGLQLLTQVLNLLRVSAAVALVYDFGTGVSVENSATTSEYKLYGYFANVYARDACILTLVAVPALVVSALLVDRLGRRTVLLIGSIGMSIGFVAIDVLVLASCRRSSSSSSAKSDRALLFSRCPDSTLALCRCVLWVITASFALSWGPLSWIYPLEVFPTHMRARGTAVSTALSASVALLLWEFAPTLAADVPFLASAVSVVSGVFVHLCCAETKRLVLEDAAAQFRNRSSALPRASAFEGARAIA